MGVGYVKDMVLWNAFCFADACSRGASDVSSTIKRRWAISPPHASLLPR